MVRCPSARGRDAIIENILMTEGTIPSPASTVILLRPEARDGFEVLLTRRPAAMKFLGGYYVFPGGGVEDRDFSEESFARCHGLSRIAAQNIFDNEISADLCLGHWVAAVREVFEETGIHFFVTEDGAFPDSDRGGLVERLRRHREALQKGETSFPRLLHLEGLYCDLSRLAYFFHRITPEKYPVRFDTRFFLAPLPDGQAPLCSSEEVAESLWITPQKALERSESNDFPLMPPTLIALRALDDHGSWRRLRAAYQLK